MSDPPSTTQGCDVFRDIRAQQADQIRKSDPIEGAMDGLHRMAAVENPCIVMLVLGFPIHESALAA